tara:strand:- start:201 stop:665 length:465 start_codon:yes stop_codon:yes gene_type:complete
MFFKTKYHKFLFPILLLFILIGCKLQEPYKNHGILFLENRSNKLKLNYDNKNTVEKLIGSPHTKSNGDQDDWIYIERVLTKGSFHKLGQNVVKTNNVLVLTFDKYGVLVQKNFLDKKKLNDIAFSKDITENNLSKKSFIQSFLASVKSKMYKGR